MNGYLAFYNNKKKEIHANTLLQAKLKAIEFFKPPKSKQHLVFIELAEIDNKQVTTISN